MFRNQIYVQSTTCVVMYVFYFFACAFYHIYFQKESTNDMEEIGMLQNELEKVTEYLEAQGL